MSDGVDADGRGRTGSAADRKATVTKTMAVTGGTAVGVIVLMWVFQCIQAHKFVIPTIDQTVAILAVGGPFFHLAGRIVLYWMSRMIPKNANI